jgi:hypothetical protein
MTLSELEEMKRQRLISELSESDKNEDIESSSPKLVQDLNMSKNAGNHRFEAYFKDYVKETGYEQAFLYDNSDTGCDTDVSSWSPSENFVAAIWHTVYAKSKLLGIANVGFDVKAGHGNRVDIRTIGKFAAPSSLNACECASCASNTLGTYSITLSQYALGFVECNFELWDVGFELYKKEVEALGFRYAEFFDDQLYSELNTATAGNTIDLANALSCTPGMSGSCCTDTSLVDLYNAVIEGKATMEAADYNPDVLIMSPTVASILMRMQTPSVQPWASSIISIDSNGQLSKFAGLKVIVTSSANACSAVSGTHVAIMIDSKRALGAAFGKRPFLLTEQSASCNSVESYMWCYFGASELDTDAILHIENP